MLDGVSKVLWRWKPCTRAKVHSPSPSAQLCYVEEDSQTYTTDKKHPHVIFVPTPQFLSCIKPWTSQIVGLGSTRHVQRLVQQKILPHFTSLAPWRKAGLRRWGGGGKTWAVFQRQDYPFLAVADRFSSEKGWRPHWKCSCCFPSMCRMHPPAGNSPPKTFTDLHTNTQHSRQVRGKCLTLLTKGENWS